jgi:nucleotide-binding universal stress UspA family protein
MKNIKNIIVPTDFSPTALNALHYAESLAEILDATITVVHVNEYILPGAEIVVSPISELEVSRLTETSMQMFVANEEEDDSSGVVVVKNRVKTKILKGDLVGQLVDLSALETTDLIVIGTTGFQDFFTKTIGSTSLQVANKALCPVILVPKEAHWRGLDKIMYASNFESMAPKMIQEVTRFAAPFNAVVHFVNVKDISSDESIESAEINWEELFPKSHPNQSFEVHSIYGRDSIKELKAFAEKNNINLTAFVSKHRSFWENLMHKSITENMALSNTIPMMVIHLDD